MSPEIRHLRIEIDIILVSPEIIREGLERRHQARPVSVVVIVVGSLAYEHYVN
jgi:hypothetical protein